MSNFIIKHLGVLEARYVDSTELFELRDSIVRGYSIAHIYKDLGLNEALRDSINYLKYLISEFVLRLATGKYIDGLAAELSEAIPNRLWEIELDDFSFKAFLTDIIGFWENMLEDGLSSDDAEFLIEEFATLFNVDLSKVPALLNKIRSKSVTPEEALQSVLVGLVVSVGGVSPNVSN
jgi:hypothetical protein